MFVGVTSGTIPSNEISFIEKVKAQLNFYQDKKGNINYSSNPGLWTSSWYSQMGAGWEFSEVMVTSVPVWPEVNDIKSSNINIQISRDSH